MKILKIAAIVTCLSTFAFAEDAPFKQRLNTLQISENKLVSIVVNENESVKRAAIETMISEQSIKNTKSIFEPSFEFSWFAKYNYEQNNREQSIQRSTATEYKSKDYDYNASINGIVPAGTKYKLYYELNDPSNSLQTDEEFGREKKAKVGLELVQPLLKDFGIKANTANIKIANLNKKISEYKENKQKMLTAFNAVTNYSDIQFFQYRGNLEARILELENERLKMTSELVAAGRLSKSDIFDIETMIARKEARLSYTARMLRKSSSVVRQMLLGTDSQTLSFINASDELEPAPSMLEEVPQNIDEYVLNRPDYKQAIAEMQIAEIKVDYAQNQNLHDLELVAEYGMSELNETGHEASKLLGGGKYEYWNFGVRYKAPLGGKKGNSALAAAELRRNMSISNTKVIKGLIKDEILSAYSELETSYKEALKQKEALAKLEALLEQDTQKMEGGKGSPYSIIARKIEILQAKIDLAEKTIQYKKALMGFKLAKGIILQGYDS